MITEKLLSKDFRFNHNYIPKGMSKPQEEARKLFLDEIHKKNKYITVTECPFCGARNFTKISETNRRALPSDVVICNNCEGCFKSVKLNKEGNKYHYENISYALRGKSLSDRDIENLFWYRVKTLANERYHFISHFAYLDPKKDLITELGCGDGANLFPWRERGFEVLGVELDERLVGSGRKKDINIIQGDVTNLEFRNKKPSLIILSHVLEHVEDANILLKKLYSILKPNAFLFIEVPGIRFQGLVNALKYFDIEHNFNFDQKSLTGILKKQLFNIIYADEYSRVLCTPKAVQESLAGKRVSLSLSRINAFLLKAILSLVKPKTKKLRKLLQEGENNNLRIKMFSKLQTLYFREYYRSIAKTQGKNVKKN